MLYTTIRRISVWGSSVRGRVSHRSLPVLLVALVFGITFLYAAVHQIHPVVDAKAYDRIALNILNGHGFRENLSADLVYDPVIVRAGPGYELLLASLYFLFGHSYLAVWVLQAALHAATAYLLFVISTRLFGDAGRSAGLVALGLFGFHPDLIEIAAMLMTETTYLFFVALILLLFIMCMQETGKAGNRRLILPVLLGTLMSFGVLFRPQLLLWVPVFLIFFLSKRSYYASILFLAGVFLAIVPWTLRNYEIYRIFIPTTLIGEYNLWVGNRTDARGGQIAEGENPAIAFAETHGYAGFQSAARGHFSAFVQEQPEQFVRLTALRTVRLASLIRPMGFWFYQSGTSQAAFVLSSLVAIATLFIAGFSGLLVYTKEHRKEFIYFGTLLFLSIAPLVVTVVESRYRFPMYPFLALFAGYYAVSYRKTDTDTRRLRYAVLFFGIISFIDAYTFFDVVITKLKLFGVLS